MPFALELALDPDSAAVVRAGWRALAAAGFPLMVELGANPHVSLAIWEEIDVAGMRAAVADLARETPVLPIVFDRIAVFSCIPTATSPTPRQESSQTWGWRARDGVVRRARSRSRGLLGGAGRAGRARCLRYDDSWIEGQRTQAIRSPDPPAPAATAES